MTTSEAAALMLVALMRGLFDEHRHEEVLKLVSIAIDHGPLDLDPDTAAICQGTILSFASASSYQLARYDEAQRFAEEGMTISESIEQQPNLTLTRNVGHRALAKDALGDLAGAAEDYRLAEQMATALGDEALSEVSSGRTAYAELLFHRGQVTEALNSLAQPMAPVRAGDATRAQANMAGWVAASTGDADTAVKGFAAVYDEAISAGSLHVAGIVACNLAMVFNDQGKKDLALERLAESASLLERVGAREQLAVTLYNTGTVHLDWGESEEAAPYLKQALSLLLDVSPRSPKILLALKQIALVRIVQKDFRRARAALRRGINLYEQIRPDIGQAEAEHQGIFDNYRCLVELHLLVSLHEDWLDEVFELIERSKARYWAETITPLGDAASEERFRPEGIPSATARNVFLLSFFCGPNMTFVMYGLNGQLSARRLDVGDQEMRELVQGFTFDLLASSSRDGLERAHADRLSQLLLAEVNPRGARAIHILPDGALWAAPFDALPWNGGDTLLGSVAPVVTAPSIHIVRSMRKRHHEADPDLVPCVLARPEVGGSVPDVPGAERQAMAIKDLFPDSRILVGNQATRAEMLRAMADAACIHVAAHAMARASERPYILLCDGRGGPDRVYIEDIVNTPIRARLVFLAACSTSVGASSSGEGLISIGRAFLFAGARCVIGTLWPVPEEETLMLVSSFYEMLADGETTVFQAMSAAKKAARDKGMSTRTWAAFQIIGDAFADLDPIQSILDKGL